MALWGKKPAEPAPAPQPERRAAEPPAQSLPAIKEKETPMAMMKKEDELPRTTGDLNALLGRGTEFEGKLTFEGEVRLAGKFNGEIFSKDRLQVDETAKVKAEISVGSIIVFGEIVGNIRASQLVELKASARVKGNIESPALVIERGVIFEGCCKMENLGKAPTAAMPKAEEKK